MMLIYMNQNQYKYHLLNSFRRYKNMALRRIQIYPSMQLISNYLADNFRHRDF